MIQPVDAPRSQTFGENPTKNLPWNSWLIQTFGNYQPDGHSGEDYACDVGTPVRAVTSGTVLHIGWMGGTYADNPWWIAPNFAGYCAVIDHGSLIGIYGHCQDGSAKVVKGQRVTEGQVFILSGNTGGSTGPHLHFEILPDGYILQSAFYGRIDPAGIFAGSLSLQSGSTTPIQEEEDDMPSLEEIFNYPIARKGGSMGGETTLGAVVAYFDANVEGTRNIVKESAGAAVSAIFATELARQGGPGGKTTLAATIAYLDANLDKLDADQILDPEAVKAAVSAATEAALKDISITLTTEGK